MSHPAPPRDRGPGAAVVVTVVMSVGCHLCDDAETALAGLAESYPLVSDRVDIRSERGQALVGSHRSPMSPLVLVDGAFFSAGRLPRRKLIKLLEQRFAGSPVAAPRHGGQAS